MKLQLVGRELVSSRGGSRFLPVFETPNGTRVVRLKSGYFPVSRDGSVHMNRRFMGREGRQEVWETQSKMHTRRMIDIDAGGY